MVASTATATVAPHDLEAEENLLGCILLPPGRAISRVRDRIATGDFYRDTHRIIYQAALDLDRDAIPVDLTVLADHLRRHKLLDEIGGTERIHELARIVPAVGNIDYYAAIVRRTARDRDAYYAGQELQQAASNGGLDARPELRDKLDRVLHQRDDGATALTGKTHAQLVTEQLEPAPAFLVDDLVEPGILMTIAGVPETHKSWLAFQIAAGVAAGKGEILGRHVQDQGAVGYVWEDDSTRNEIERVQLYAARHNHPQSLPIHWYLNTGVTLPRDTARLRATIQEHDLRLLVLDSLYNLIGGVDLKDTEVGGIYATLKRDLCDRTGCTILIVDHMAWATEINRARLRSYGDVFKTAAVRAGIYIDAQGKHLFIEARGNNIKGFTRTPCYWVDEQLELRLIEAEHVTDEELEDRVIAYLKEHGWTSTGDVQKGVEGRDSEVRKALDRLDNAGRVQMRSAGQLADLGRGARGKYWNLSIHAGNEVGPLFPADLGRDDPQVHGEDEVCPVGRPLYVVEGRADLAEHLDHDPAEPTDDDPPEPTE